MQKILTVLAPAAFAVLIGTCPAEAQNTRHDGAWSVELTTVSGACGGPFRVMVSIEGGTLRLGRSDPGAMQLGYVTAAGAVTAQLRQGGVEAVIRGRLVNSGGSGEWNLAREGAPCAGRWLADKVGPRL